MSNIITRNLINRQNQKDYQKTLKQSFACATFDTKGVLKHCNENFIALLGYSDSKEIVGFHHHIFVDNDFSKTPEYQSFWSTLASGETLSGEFKRIKKDTTNILVQGTYAPLKDGNGQVIGVTSICTEISSSKSDNKTSAAIKNAIDLRFAFANFTPSGMIIKANESFLKTFGYDDLNDIVGKHHSMFVPNSFKNSPAYAEFWQELKQGKIQQGDFERVAKNGSTVWIQASYSPVINEKGEIESILKLATDITHQKQLASNVKDLKDTIDLSFGFIQFDPNGIITDVNKNFYTLLGYTHPAEVLNQHHSIFVTPETSSSNAYHDFWAALKKGITQKGEFKRITKAGKEVWIHAAYTPLKNSEGKVVSVIKIAADITTNKLAALKAKQDLQQEVLLNLKEISSSIGQIASGARDQAMKTDESSSQIERALQSSNEVSSKAKLIKDVANQAATNSEIGELTISELVNSMNTLNEVATQTELAMDFLTKNTRQIHGVLNVLKDISNQTNLLALNASIEAAQAGDYGRGFSVIAREVRDLAENSSKSALQIETLISSIHDGSNKVTAAMKEVTERVSEGIIASSQVKDIFKKMSESTNQTSTLSGTILGAAETQTDGMNEIVKTIESIVVIAEQTAAGAEEVSSASKSLENQIEHF